MKTGPARAHNCPLRARSGVVMAIPSGCHRGAAVGNFGAVLGEFPGVARQHSVSGDGVRKRFSENFGIGLFQIKKPGNRGSIWRFGFGISSVKFGKTGGEKKVAIFSSTLQA